MGHQSAAPLLAVVALACSGGGATMPTLAIDGYYALASVNGQALPYVPPPSVSSPTVSISVGDLALRADGTFGRWVKGSGFETGRYRADGSTLYLTYPPRRLGASITDTLVTSGDSLVGRMSGLISSPFVNVVFRRSTSAPAVTTGLYVLTAINGRGAPFVLTDVVFGTDRFVHRVSYDSITFMDGVFFRQHRMERQVRYLPSGDSLAGYTELVETASYRGQGSSLALYHSFDPTDILALEQEKVVRRRTMGQVTDIDQYTRQP